MKKKSLSAQKQIHNLILSYLKDKKVSKIYSKFDKFLNSKVKVKKIAVGVSGGPDSLALAYFTKCFSIIHKYKVSFFIVDHGLRKHSSKEAKTVQLFLKKFDIQCNILKWKNKKPKSNIQSIARTNRYKLLYNACKNKKINNLLIGHHIDDLYENFFIRLLRGSGLKGLTSFGSYTDHNDNGISILRPFINLEKEELLYVVHKVFNFYIDDPSNQNLIFKRTKIREFILNLKKEGFDKKKLHLTLKNLKSSNDTINFYVKKNIKDNSKFIQNKNIYILNKYFFNQSTEVSFRSFSIILKSISRNYYPPRGKSIFNLLDQICKGRVNKITLGGCFVEKINETVLISKET